MTRSRVAVTRASARQDLYTFCGWPDGKTARRRKLPLGQDGERRPSLDWSRSPLNHLLKRPLVFNDLATCGLMMVVRRGRCVWEAKSGVLLLFGFVVSRYGGGAL